MPTSMPDSTRKLTHADYLLFPDDGKRHELVDGVHYVSPSPVARHQAIVGNLHLLVGSRVRERRLGRLLLAPLDVILSDVDVVAPDLLFVRRERGEIVQEWVRGAPDLVVEVLSPSTRERDLGIKRELYERHAIAEYWVLDPAVESVRVHRLRDGAYGDPDLLLAVRDDLLSSPLFGDLRVSVRQVFET